MVTQEQISDLLVNHGFAPPQNRHASYLSHPRQFTAPLAWRYAQAPTPEELGRELFDLAESQALQLGTWLATTDGEIVTRSVEAVIPPYLRPDIELLVEGLKWAARLQQQKGRQFAGSVAVAVLVGSVLLMALSLGGTRSRA